MDVTEKEKSPDERQHTQNWGEMIKQFIGLIPPTVMGSYKLWEKLQLQSQQGMSSLYWLNYHSPWSSDKWT